MPKARAPRNTDKNRFVNSFLVKKCYVHVNGKVGHIPPGGGHNWHPKLGGLKVTIHNRWGIESLLDDITRQLDMGWASKKLFTREGKPITEVSQISDEAHVVVSSGGKFMKEDVPFQMVKQGGGGGGRRGKSKRAMVTIEEWLHSWGGISLGTSLSEAMKPHLFGNDSRQYAYLYQPKGPLLPTDGGPGSSGGPSSPGSSGAEGRGGAGDRGGDGGGEEGGGGGHGGGGGGGGGGGEQDEAEMLANLIHALQHSSGSGGGSGGGSSGGAPASPERGRSAGSSTHAAPFHDGSGSGSPFAHTPTSSSMASPSPPTSPAGSSNLGGGRGHSRSSGGGGHRFVFKPHAKPRVTQRTIRVKRPVRTRYVQRAILVWQDPSYLYTPFIHIYSRTYTYVGILHPLYMY